MLVLHLKTLIILNILAILHYLPHRISSLTRTKQSPSLTINYRRLAKAQIKGPPIPFHYLKEPELHIIVKDQSHPPLQYTSRCRTQVTKICPTGALAPLI